MYDNELHFKAVCVVLASLIIIILTKLLYDYWQYRFFHIISWSSSSSAVKLASSWQSTSPHIHLIFLGTVGNYRGLSTGCPESTQNTQKILNTYSRIQTFTWESESGKLTCESFHLWKFSLVKVKVSTCESESGEEMHLETIVTWSKLSPAAPNAKYSYLWFQRFSTEMVGCLLFWLIFAFPNSQSDSTIIGCVWLVWNISGSSMFLLGVSGPEYRWRLESDFLVPFVLNCNQ